MRVSGAGVAHLHEKEDEGKHATPAMERGHVRDAGFIVDVKHGHQT